MSALDNIRLVRLHLDAANAHDPARVAREINAPDAAWTAVPSGATFHGPDGYVQFVGVWLSAFPDAHVEITDISAGDDFAVAEFVGSGTHRGPLKTPQADVPATGRSMRTSFCEVYRIKNGRISSCQLYFDSLGLMRQLGLIPE